jgi:hypothetical protein
MKPWSVGKMNVMLERHQLVLERREKFCMYKLMTLTYYLYMLTAGHEVMMALRVS